MENLIVFLKEGKHILRKYIRQYKKGSSDTVADNNKLSILHFGCWNYGCQQENSGLEKNIISINKYLETNTPDLFLVHGDNYYPESMEIQGVKYKEFDLIKLTSGFKNCLNRMNFPKKHIVMGNHDILDNNNTYIKMIKKL